MKKFYFYKRNLLFKHQVRGSKTFIIGFIVKGKREIDINLNLKP